jgi:hypothetical protein
MKKYKFISIDIAYKPKAEVNERLTLYQKKGWKIKVLHTIESANEVFLVLTKKVK